MYRVLVLFITIFFVCAASAMSQQQTVDVLYLKDGKILRGTLIRKSDFNIKFQTRDGFVHFLWPEEVKKITKEPCPDVYQVGEKTSEVETPLDRQDKSTEKAQIQPALSKEASQDVTLAEENLEAKKDSVVETGSKVVDIKQLLLLEGYNEVVVLIKTYAIRNIQKNSPTVPPDFWDIFYKQAREDVDDFIDQFIPFYDKNFSHAEIKEMILFNQTPIGRKISRLSPSLTTETTRICEEWGQALQENIIVELKKRYNKF